MLARAIRQNTFLLDVPQITVVIAYDTFELGSRAMAVHERLTERLGSTFNLRQELWKFDLLEDPALRRAAARETAAADIVILATSRDAELPLYIREWLEESLQDHTGVGAFVALFEHPHPRIQPWLEAIARRKGIDFFAQSATTESCHTSADAMPLPVFAGPAGPASSFAGN
ncbi:MAG: hypothetical protein L0Y58_02615 [Verrucomicrobia subdivision 3 bacterium]|nr:hypothetical protein [Limisphaerales bacterium]